ncbi:MAG: phosphate ABC transporter ATP-binding protein, partial [Bacteroidota bacterium]
MNKISIKNISLSFGTKEVLKDISLEVPAYSITAMIGPSGCGKSTLLRSVNRMHDMSPDAKITGDILLEGDSIYQNGIDVNLIRRRIGMVFQKPNPLPKSIRENVAYGMKINSLHKRGGLEDGIEKSLREAFLWEEVKDKLDESAFSLSGGQQQRLCIARCIAVKPEVILMDEPTSALDPIATQKIESLILKLKKHCYFICNPPGLLHIVGNNNDGIILFQFQ